MEFNSFKSLSDLPSRTIDLTLSLYASSISTHLHGRFFSFVYVLLHVISSPLYGVWFFLYALLCCFILAKSTLLLHSPFNTFLVFFMLWSSCLLTACRLLSCCIGWLMKKPTMLSSSDVCAEVWCAWHSWCIIALQFHWMSQFLCHNWHISSLLVAFLIIELMLPNGVLTLNATLHKPAHEQSNHAFFLWVCAEVWCA